jgi:aryl-alcohol dehydrogenase-like predicted oxidoreductase
MSTGLSLDSYRLLGRCGLRVSPLSLGTMTFGSDWGWGADERESQRIFDMYVERGGNLIDTANVYTNGTAEQLIGRFLKDKRDRLVIATKYTLTVGTSDPNACGNHRKSLIRSVEGSLKHLQTDYIDLLYLHAWDGTTSVEEVLRALDDVVRSGKVLHIGISDTAAWQTARMQTIAELRGWSTFAALQIEYSLVERTAERELIPMAAEMGLGILGFSPLAGGILSGKYTHADRHADTDARATGSRLSLLQELDALSDRALTIANVVKDVAAEIGRPAAQVALSWTLSNSAITAPIVGARTTQQFEGNLGALSIVLSEDQRTRLDQASAIKLGFPHDLVTELVATGYMPAAETGFATKGR